MESVKYLSLQSRVLIELTTGDKYTGTLKAFNPKFKFVELIELTDDVSKRKICGTQTFYETEIDTIRPLDATPMASVDSADSTKSSSEFASAEANSIHEWTITTIDEAELQEVNNKILSAIYIIQCDASYHTAVADLQCQEMVGLNIEGARLGRLQPGSLLSFSTNAKIYLFDLKMLGRIFKDIKQILEAEKPRKVVHNSALICDHLKNLYKCQLNGFQDTLITHCQIKKKLREISIHDCLSEYFNLPETSHQKLGRPDWQKRPLSDRRKFIAASNVAYLIKLFFHMSFDIIMRPLKRITNEYSQTYSQHNDTFKVFDHITTRKNPGLAAIDTNAINLYAFTLVDLSGSE